MTAASYHVHLFDLRCDVLHAGVAERATILKFWLCIRNSFLLCWLLRIYRPSLCGVGVGVWFGTSTKFSLNVLSGSCPNLTCPPTITRMEIELLGDFGAVPSGRGYCVLMTEQSTD